MSASKFFALVLFGLFACGQTSTAQPTSPYSFQEISTPAGYPDVLRMRDGRNTCYLSGRASSGSGGSISCIRE